MMRLSIAAALAVLAVGEVAEASCEAGKCADADKDEADASLLQARANPTISRGQHFIQFEGGKRTYVPREEMQGFVRELTISYKLDDNNGIKLNGKTATIPLSDVLQGTFARAANTMDEIDFGIEKGMAFKGNPGSMLSDRVRLAFAEKSHTLYIPPDHKLRHATKDRLEKESAAQTPAMKAQATAMRSAKLTTLAAMAAAYGGQVINAGKDTNHVDALRDYVDADDGAVSKDDLAAAQKNLDELNRQAPLAKFERPVRSSIGCLHFENEADMVFTEDSVEVPLNKRMVAYRGRLAQYPNEEYQMSSGFAFFYHDEKAGSLNIYFGFSSVVEIIDAPEGRWARFTVSPPDGNKLPIAPEGRATSIFPPFVQPIVMSAAKSVYDLGTAIPTDFEMLHLPRQKVGCGDKKLKNLPTDSQELVDRLGNTTMDPLVMIPMMVEAYSAAMSWIGCAVEYLRPVCKSAVVELGGVPLMGLLHVLAELPPESIAAMVEDEDRWNTYDGKSLEYH